MGGVLVASPPPRNHSCATLAHVRPKRDRSRQIRPSANQRLPPAGPSMAAPRSRTGRAPASPAPTAIPPPQPRCPAPAALERFSMRSGKFRVGSQGVYPTTSVIITRESPLLYGRFVFGKPFLLNHRSFTEVVISHSLVEIWFLGFLWLIQIRAREICFTTPICAEYVVYAPQESGHRCGERSGRGEN